MTKERGDTADISKNHVSSDIEVKFSEMEEEVAVQCHGGRRTMFKFAGRGR